jgi:hypothetical protein
LSVRHATPTDERVQRRRAIGPAAGVPSALPDPRHSA